MGRRSQHAPDELRELILEAAEATVREGGLSLLSAREVARRIGYSPGTIYNMYENLDDVVLRVEARLLDRLDTRLAAVTGRTPEQRLLKLAQAYLAFTHESPRLWNLLFEHHLPADQELPEWYLARLARLLAHVEAALAPLFADHEGQACRRAARVLWSSLHGITSLSTSGKLSIIAEDAGQVLAEDLVRTYLAGLASARSAQPPSLKRERTP